MLWYTEGVKRPWTTRAFNQGAFHPCVDTSSAIIHVIWRTFLRQRQFFFETVLQSPVLHFVHVLQSVIPSQAPKKRGTPRSCDDSNTPQWGGPLNLITAEEKDLIWRTFVYSRGRVRYQQTREKWKRGENGKEGIRSEALPIADEPLAEYSRSLCGTVPD